ncbi:MAG: peptide-N-glycosidase F-related protein [Minicystis sp.]
MRRTPSRLLALFALPLLAAPLFAACSEGAAPTTSSGTTTTTGGTTTTTAATTTGTGGSGGTGGQGGAGGTAPDVSALCKAQMLPIRSFAEGPYGTHLGELADDFTVDLLDGTSFHLKEQFSGCESYVFIPDRLAISELEPASVWSVDKDLLGLIKASPRNVHYFFVSRMTTDATADESLKAMQARVDAVFSKLAAADAEHWKGHLHVVTKRAANLGNWITGVLGSHGKLGFSLDRGQRIRGAGNLADVKRFSADLNAQMKWPWKANLAYAANDPKYFNAQSLLQDKMDAESATVVKLWDGEILAEKADTMAMLPSAAEIAGFDTLEVEVTQQCPDPELIELGNCGAWDYIANLFLVDDEQNQVELSRFITSYHRETHWVVDASPMLALLASGGAHKFRWSFAPSWNTQPTATKLSLRFSNQKKAAKVTQSVFLWAGGGFGSGYNTGRLPVDVPIPATTKKVELWTIITGHGSGTGQCSEFCNHQHEFSVNDKAHLEEFKGAGNDNGCIAHLDNGMTPNQAGTWWFGRGGWCPGQQVDPWVMDVTADVIPGQTATVSYRGLYKNVDPPPDGAGDIAMVSYLVISE